MKTSATPRKPSRKSRRAVRPPGTSRRAPGPPGRAEPPGGVWGAIAGPPTLMLEPPREDVGRRDLHDDGVRWAQRGLARVLRIFPVEQVAPAAKTRPALVHLRAALDHHAAQQAPGIGVGVDHHRHLRILGDVL